MCFCRFTSSLSKFSFDKEITHFSFDILSWTWSKTRFFYFHYCFVTILHSKLISKNYFSLQYYKSDIAIQHSQSKLSNLDTRAAGVSDDYLFISFLNLKINHLSHNLIPVYQTCILDKYFSFTSPNKWLFRWKLSINLTK